MLFFNSETEKYMEFLEECGLPTDDNDYFWMKYQGRFIEEVSKMADNTNAQLSCEDGKLIWEEDISNNFGTEFTISIEVPEGYPYKMPRVLVTYSEIDLPKSKHRYKDGSLCLLHPSEYHSVMSILDFRNMASAWCWAVEVYQNTGEWPAGERPH